jgi:hypothetical protein
MIAPVLAKQNCKSLLFGKMSKMLNFWSNRSQKVQIFIPKNCFTGINFGYKTPNSQEKGMARKLCEFECFGFTLLKKVFDIYSSEFKISLKLCVFDTPNLTFMREKT